MINFLPQNPRFSSLQKKLGADGQMDRHTDGQLDKKTVRWTDSKMDGWTCPLTEMQSYKIKTDERTNKYQGNYSSSPIITLSRLSLGDFQLAHPPR